MSKNIFQICIKYLVFSLLHIQHLQSNLLQVCDLLSYVENLSKNNNTNDPKENNNKNITNNNKNSKNNNNNSKNNNNKSTNNNNNGLANQLHKYDLTLVGTNFDTNNNKNNYNKNNNNKNSNNSNNNVNINNNNNKNSNKECQLKETAVISMVKLLYKKRCAKNSDRNKQQKHQQGIFIFNLFFYYFS